MNARGARAVSDRIGAISVSREQSRGHETGRWSRTARIGPTAAAAHRMTLSRIAIGLSVVTGGCGALQAGAVVVGAVPVITTAVAKVRGRADSGTSGQRLRAGATVVETGAGWSRELVDAVGHAVNTATYRPGEVLALRWDIPIDVAAGVEAIVGIADASCASRSIPLRAAPTRWTVRDVATARTTRAIQSQEAWRVDAQSTTSAAGDNRNTLGLLDAHALASDLHLAPGATIAWLLIVPAPGRKILQVDWEGADPDVLLGQAPCISAWRGVPLDRAVAATASVASAGSISRLATSPQYSADASRTWGVLSLDPTVSRLEVDSVGQSFALIGVPAYDLVRLDAIAAAREADQTSGRRIAASADRALRAIRGDRLSTLTKESSTGMRTVCQLVSQYGLDRTPRRLWDAEPTIPRRLATGCHDTGAP